MMLTLALLIALAPPQAPRAALLDADRALARLAARAGLRQALAEALADQAVLVHAGAPVLRGRSTILAALARDHVLDTLAVTWEAREGWISSDGRFGVTTGLTRVTPGKGEPRIGVYIAGWRRGGADWRLVGLMQTGLIPPGRELYDPAWGPKVLPALAASGPAADLVQADLDFAALAGRESAGAAFRAFAAPGAFTSAGPGRWNEGPEAIGTAIAGGPPADWVWFPVAAEVAGSGDLGFTVGQAVISPRSGGDPIYSKYLTVWARQPDGRVKYLTDGGNPRPRP